MRRGELSIRGGALLRGWLHAASRPCPWIGGGARAGRAPSRFVLAAAHGCGALVVPARARTHLVLVVDQIAVRQLRGGEVQPVRPLVLVLVAGRARRNGGRRRRRRRRGGAVGGGAERRGAAGGHLIWVVTAATRRARGREVAASDGAARSAPSPTAHRRRPARWVSRSSAVTSAAARNWRSLNEWRGIRSATRVRRGRSLRCPPPAAARRTPRPSAAAAGSPLRRSVLAAVGGGGPAAVVYLRAVPQHVMELVESLALLLARSQLDQVALVHVLPIVVRRGRRLLASRHGGPSVVVVAARGEFDFAPRST